MKLARIARHGLDGISARLVVVQPETGLMIDLVTSERLRLEKQGATQDAALRLATALFPASMTAALALGETFLSAARQASASAAAQAILPLADAHFLPPLDPPLMRDFLAFETHIRNASARMGQSPAEELFDL